MADIATECSLSINRKTNRGKQPRDIRIGKRRNTGIVSLKPKNSDYNWGMGETI
jgi:hypothetical protein